MRPQEDDLEEVERFLYSWKDRYKVIPSFSPCILYTTEFQKRD